MLDFDTVTRTRHSVRGFSKREVPRATIDEALSLAQCSPSNCNAQPWHVTVVRGPRCDRLRQRLVAAFDAGTEVDENATPAFTGELRSRQIACAVELYGKMGVARGDREGRRDAERRNFELFGAPQVAIVCMNEEFSVGVALDVGCWLQTFLLALWSRGVAACPQAALRCYGTLIKDELGIAPGLRVLCGVSFGYEDETVPANAARMPRTPIAEAVTFLDD